MDVELKDFKIVSSPGLKHKWKIPAADVKIVDNETFVRLRPFSYTLCGMVFEGNHDAGAPSTSHKERAAGESLTCSHGYNQLVKLRNEACVPPVEGSDLFDVPNVKKPKANMSRLELQQKRYDENFEAIQLDLDLGAGALSTITVLKHVGSARDALWIKFEKESIGAVIQFIRSKGFSPKKTQFKHQGGPGIFKRNDYFTVKRIGSNGKPIYKKCEDLDEAMQVQSTELEAAENDSAEQPTEEDDEPPGQKSGEEEADYPAEDTYTSTGDAPDSVVSAVEPVEQAAAGVVPGLVMGEVKKRQVSLAQCWAK